MMRHDPNHVAHIAAIILSSRPEVEGHHIKAAVASARAVLDEAHRSDEEPAVAEAAVAEAVGATAATPDVEKTGG